MRSFYKLLITLFLVFFISLAWAQDNNLMQPYDDVSAIEQLINQKLSQLGISDAKLVLSQTSEGMVQVIISYRGEEEKIVFTKEEIENAKQKKFSSETKQKVLKSLLNFAPGL